MAGGWRLAVCAKVIIHPRLFKAVGSPRGNESLSSVNPTHVPNGLRSIKEENRPGKSC